MGTHMKTTIDIADAILLEAKETAARNGTTVKALVEAGLRQVLAERRQQEKPFVLRKASFKGRGLKPKVQGADG
jgi:hypothetical protein